LISKFTGLKHYSQYDSLRLVENQSKIDNFNANILLNPGWGQATKAIGIEAQKAANKPKSKKAFFVDTNKNILGGKKKKEAFLNKLKLNSSASVRHLPQPPLGASYGHGIFKNQL
jgi:hypothetical protein